MCRSEKLPFKKNTFVYFTCLLAGELIIFWKRFFSQRSMELLAHQLIGDLRFETGENQILVADFLFSKNVG